MEPEVNHAVLEFAQQHFRQKVGARGTCWDLAEEALKKAGGTSSTALTPKQKGVLFKDADYVWGSRFHDYRELRPGDIIQFRNHIIKTTKTTTTDTTTRTMTTIRTVGHHTAIVESVGPEDGQITILEQHVTAPSDDSNKKKEIVRRSVIHLKSGSFTGVGVVEVTGSAMFYHPNKQ